MFIGSELSGVSLDYFTSGSAAHPVHHWTGFWLTSSIGALVLFVAIAAFFADKTLVHSKAADLAQEFAH